MTSDFKPNTGKPTGGQSPILLMNGTLDSWVAESRTYDENTPNARTAMSIRFKYRDIEPLELREPYPWPTAEIVIPYTDPNKSSGGTRWEAWTSSGRKVFGGVFELDDLVGKRQKVGQLPFKLRQSLVDEEGNPKLDSNGKQLWGDVESLAWQIVEVEGAGSAKGAAPKDDFDYMAEQAEGCDDSLFYQKLIQDQRITSNQTVVQQVTGRTLVTNLVNLGKITKDEQGVLHTVHSV